MSKNPLFKAVLAVLLSSALLAGTRTAHAQRPRPTPTPTPISNEASATAANDPLLAPPPPAPRTIASWGEALAFLRERSTDLKIAYADVKRAEGDSRIALAGMLPTITGTGLLTHNILNSTAPGTPVCDGTTGTCSTTATNQALVPTALDGAIVGVLPLFAPRTWHQVGTASLEEDVAKLGVEAQKRKIVLGVATAVIAVVTSERIAELNRNGLRVSLQRYDLAMQKKTIGGGTQLDVLRARADVDAARATVVTGDEGLRQAREALGLALGIGGEVGVAASISMNALETSTRGACKGAAVEERADVKAARGRFDLAEREVTDVKWQFSPTITAQSTLAASALNVTPNPVWNIQGVLTVPIWDGGARYGLLRKANADVDEAEARLTETRRQVDVEIEQARRGVDVAEAQRKVVQDARDSAKETDDLTQLGFRTGQGTSLELVIAASQLRQSEINLALGDFQLVRARVAELLSRSNCPF